MSAQLELFLQVSAVLAIIYGVIRVFVVLQIKARKGESDKKEVLESIRSIDTKIDLMGNDINKQTLYIQKVERDGVESIRLTQALHGRVDKLNAGFQRYKIKQAKVEEQLRQHSEELRTLRDTQRFKFIGPKDEK
jgi:hypothetical protein